MSSYASGAKLSELTLAGEPPVKSDAPVDGQPQTPAAPGQDIALRAVQSGVVEEAVRVRVRTADDYLDAATREFEGGDLDRALWAKAIELSGNDIEVAKPAYLRARATALRAAKRTQRVKERSRDKARQALDERPWVAPIAVTTKVSRKPLAIGVGAIAIVALLSAFLLLRSKPDATPAAVAPSGSAPRAAPPPAPATVTPTKPAGVQGGIGGDDLARKVADFKAAGNWNLLTLYAVEWTRKVPDSGDAWTELGMGYLKLRQLNEALDATTKAVQLAPKNLQAWQTLGEIDVALQQPAAAAVAYERALALNERDVASLVQLGALYSELTRLPDARGAFDKALAISPTDLDALCGATSVAQKEGRAKDADVLARQVRAADLHCREPVAPPVVAAPAVAAKTAVASPARNKSTRPGAR